MESSPSWFQFQIDCQDINAPTQKKCQVSSSQSLLYSFNQCCFFWKKSPDFKSLFRAYICPSQRTTYLSSLVSKAVQLYCCFTRPFLDGFSTSSSEKGRTRTRERNNVIRHVEWRHMFFLFGVSRSCGGHLQTFRASWDCQSLLEETRNPECFQNCSWGRKVFILLFWSFISPSLSQCFQLWEMFGNWNLQLLRWFVGKRGSSNLYCQVFFAFTDCMYRL